MLKLYIESATALSDYLKAIATENSVHFNYVCLTTRKIITERASSFLEIIFKTPISIQIKSNPNQIHSFFCSPFFLCLQYQPELCGNYHLLQFCFSFFVRIHGQPEPFGGSIILQSCSSFFFRLHGQPELFARDHLLQS